MSDRFFTSVAFAIVVAALWLGAVSAAGQEQTVERWVPPRTPDGQPDMQGHWNVRSGRRTYEAYTLEGLPGSEEHTRLASGQARGPLESVVIDPPDGKIPYQPWALARRNEISVVRLNPTQLEHVDPRTRCFLAGTPRQVYELMGGVQILQTPGHVVMLWEFAHSYRIIPLGDRPHIAADVKLWQGNSQGRWDGNTLVVNTTNQNGKWLDVLGDFHSDALRVVERLTVVDADTLRYQATLEDPKVYARPWTIALRWERNKEPGFELLEMACYEGNRDLDNIFPAKTTQEPGSVDGRDVGR